jgi:hypothetical protein
VSMMLGLTNKGAPGTHATVTAEIILDRRAVKEAAVVLDGGQAMQVPIQAVFPLSGTHTIGAAYSAKYSARGPDVSAGPISLVAIALPKDS